MSVLYDDTVVRREGQERNVRRKEDAPSLSCSWAVVRVHAPASSMSRGRTCWRVRARCVTGCMSCHVCVHLEVCVSNTQPWQLADEWISTVRFVPSRSLSPSVDSFDSLPSRHRGTSTFMLPQLVNVHSIFVRHRLNWAQVHGCSDPQGFTVGQ